MKNRAFWSLISLIFEVMRIQRWSKIPKSIARMSTHTQKATPGRGVMGRRGKGMKIRQRLYLIHPVCDHCNLLACMCLYTRFYGCGRSYLFNAFHIIDIKVTFKFFSFAFMESHQQTVILVSAFCFSSEKNNNFEYRIENERKRATEMQEEET
jgi:hypothetical protein